MPDPTPAPIPDVIERLERAEGACREMNRLVHFHFVHPWLAEKCVKWVDAAFEPEGEFLWWDADRLAAGKEGYSDRYEPVTASIDAALTLVPDGVGIDLKRYWLLPGEAWSAVLYVGIEGEMYCAEDAPTPAIALTLAALRAILAAGDGGRS